MACSECLPARFSPLAERTCFSQVGGLCDDYASTDPANRDLHMLALARGAYTIAGFDDDVFAQVGAHHQFGFQ